MTSSEPTNSESLSSTKGFDRKLPSGIWVLGFVSLFMDTSSELVHSLLPIFMTTVLGASIVTVGIIEGVAEGIAATTKIFSGAASDYFRKRKLLAVIGYALGALSKVRRFWGLHMAFTQGLLSKLVADTAPSDLRGTAFGVFNLVSGGMLMLASLIAGSLWSIYGASATFIAGASFAALAATGLLFYRPSDRSTGYRTGHVRLLNNTN